MIERCNYKLEDLTKVAKAFLSNLTIKESSVKIMEKCNYKLEDLTKVAKAFLSNFNQ